MKIPLIYPILLLAAAVLTHAGCVSHAQPVASPTPPRSFEECVAQGGKILKSLPAQCVSAEGLRFIDEGARPLRDEKPCKNVCGNGKCEEMVCMALGCPCAETAQSCPQDCSQ